MARLCERPGCSQPADVFYGIDTDNLIVWIESFDLAANVRAGVLCRRHADAMVVPLGWMLDDRREAIPRLFKTPAHESVAAAKPRRRRAQHPPLQGHQLELGEESLPFVAAAEAAPAVSDEDHEVLAWVPVFDETDDLDGLLGARSPLLARAFRGEDRKRPGS